MWPELPPEWLLPLWPFAKAPRAGPRHAIPNTKTNAVMDFNEVIVFPFSNGGLTESTVGQTVRPVVLKPHTRGKGGRYAEDGTFIKTGGDGVPDAVDVVSGELLIVIG
jgi:hypothetical protein